jgi:hypothetical protein
MSSSTPRTFAYVAKSMRSLDVDPVRLARAARRDGEAPMATLAMEALKH